MAESPKKPEIPFLIELLDDENEQSASLAMAELLKQGSGRIGEYLRDLQESSNPRLRRRIHQLESALRKRERREHFLNKVKQGELELLAGLIQLHLCWFDNDSHEMIASEWGKLRKELQEFAPKDLTELALFMKKQGFKTPSIPGMHPDTFCIGVALEDQIGSDLLLSALCVILSAYMPHRAFLFRCGKEFGVTDAPGSLLFPGDDWKLYSGTEGKDHPVIWGTTEILRFAASILFFSATATDGFRYMYTLGMPLAKSLGMEDLSFLPYPYGKTKNLSE